MQEDVHASRRCLSHQILHDLEDQWVTESDAVFQGPWLHHYKTCLSHRHHQSCNGHNESSDWSCNTNLKQRTPVVKWSTHPDERAHGACQIWERYEIGQTRIDSVVSARKVVSHL